MIFVVDDDASRRDVLPWFLRSVELQFTTFASARDFCTIAARMSPAAR